MMQSTLLSLSALLALVPFVTAHGYVTDVKIDGTTYKGHPYQEETVTPAPDSAIRLVSSKGPITDVSNPELACGPGALPAGLLASAHPGSNISFDWVSTDPSKNYHWFHSAGPILTYMALCEGAPCDQFNASGAKWFKTDEVGLKPGSHTEWYLADLTKGDPYTTEIPDGLKAGQYLIRNEIIANHISPVEFYVSCTQLNVTGDGNGVPDSTVSFPGAYHADDPGLQGFRYNDPTYTYTSFPGPPIAKLVSGDGHDNGGSAQSASASSSPKDSQASSALPSTTSSTHALDKSQAPTDAPCTCKSPTGTASAQASATSTSAPPNRAGDSDHGNDSDKGNTPSSSSVTATASGGSSGAASSFPPTDMSSSCAHQTDAPKRRRLSHLVRKRVLGRV